MGSQDSVQGNEQKTHGAYLRVCAMQQSGKHAGRGAGGEGNKAGPAGGGSKDAGAAEGGRPLSLSVRPVTALSCLAFGVRFWLGLARGVLGSPSHPPSGPLFVLLLPSSLLRGKPSSSSSSSLVPPFLVLSDPKFSRLQFSQGRKALNLTHTHKQMPSKM